MPSTVIKNFSYDEKSKSLTIIFVTGMVYSYKKVPKEVFEMLKAAGSKGRYFNYNIKEKYQFEKIEEM